MSFRRFADSATRVLVNGIPGGVAWAPDGSPFAVLALTVRGGRIVRIDVLADPDRLGRAGPHRGRRLMAVSLRRRHVCRAARVIHMRPRTDPRKETARCPTESPERLTSPAAASAVGPALQPHPQAPPGGRRSAGTERPRHHPRPHERPAPHHGRWRSSTSRAGAGSGRPGARSTGCATCALPGARPSRCAAGARTSRRPSWTRRSGSSSSATSSVPSREASRSASRSSASSTASTSTIPVGAAEGRSRLRAPLGLTRRRSTRVASPTSQRVGRGSSSGSNCSMPVVPGSPNTVVGVAGRPRRVGSRPSARSGRPTRPSSISSGQVSFVTNTSTTRRSSSASSTRAPPFDDDVERGKGGAAERQHAPRLACQVRPLRVARRSGSRPRRRSRSRSAA